MKPLAIDKSFAQSISIGRLHELRNQYHFIVPTAFYYELFTTDARKRRMTVQGFPEFQRIHLANLFRNERELCKPAISIDRKIMRINSAVAEEKFGLGQGEQSLVDRHERESVFPRVDFWVEVAKSGVPGFSAEELRSCLGPPEVFAALCTTLRARYRVRRIAEAMRYPHASKLDERWLYFRLLQALALQGLVVIRKYGNPKNQISRKNLEHDVQDLEYLTLGLHAGRLATSENSKKFERMSMKWRFEILEPGGSVITD